MPNVYESPNPTYYAAQFVPPSQLLLIDMYTSLCLSCTQTYTDHSVESVIPPKPTIPLSWYVNTKFVVHHSHLNLKCRYNLVHHTTT